MHNEDTYLNDEDLPVLFSNNTNWRPTPFMTLLDYINRIEPAQEPDYDKVALADAQ